jgi:tetratricopeptide (TPR) repeat protein
MKIDRGLLGTLAVAALGAACASAGGGGGGSAGPRITVPVPSVTCSTGPLATSPAADSAAATLELMRMVADSAQQGQRTLARQQAGRAIAGNPGGAYGYYLAGRAAIGLADYADADSLLRRSVELCPELADNEVTEVTNLRRYAAQQSVERAGGLMQSADTAGATVAYQTALSLDPTAYPAEFYLGLVAFNRQNTDEAVRRWRRVIETIDQLPADSADIMAARAETRGNTLNALVLASAQYLNRQQSAQAAELLAELTRLLPNSPDAWYNYSLALNNLQRYNDLVPVARRATEISPLSYGAWILYYNAFAGQSQAATQAGNTAQAGELGRQAREVSARSEGLPVQLEGISIDTEGANTQLRGTAVGTESRAPVQVEFTLHGATGELGRGTVTITPPARDQQSRFELTIPNSAPVLGITYRVVGS